MPPDPGQNNPTHFAKMAHFDQNLDTSRKNNYFPASVKVLAKKCPKRVLFGQKWHPYQVTLKLWNGFKFLSLFSKIPHMDFPYREIFKKITKTWNHFTVSEALGMGVTLPMPFPSAVLVIFFAKIAKKVKKRVFSLFWTKKCQKSRVVTKNDRCHFWPEIPCSSYYAGFLGFSKMKILKKSRRDIVKGIIDFYLNFFTF